MKRLILLIVFLFIVSLSHAANKMSMVTYFPVPYVAYSQVNVDQQLDVGLTTTCNMNLGCNQSNTNLKANTVNLKGGKLELNNGKGILGDSITLGTGNATGQISFKDVRIQSGDMQSVNADTVNVQTLNLFGKPFPSCKDKDGKGQMQWQQLKLQGYSGTDGELYLTCGELAESEPEPEECQPPSGQSYSEKCPYSEQYLTYTWNKDTCAYVKSGRCITRYLTGLHECQWLVDVCMSNSEFDRDFRGYSLSTCGFGATAVSDDLLLDDFHQSVGNAIKYNFKFLASGHYAEDEGYLACRAGEPCSSCELGKKYIYRSLSHKVGEIQMCVPQSERCVENGSAAKSVSILVTYAECRETSEDWMDLTDRDGSIKNHQICNPSTWSR